MKGEIIRRLETVLTALNNVDVSGKRNMTNLVNSIYILEDVERILEKMNVTTAEAPQADTEEQTGE